MLNKAALLAFRVRVLILLIFPVQASDTAQTGLDLPEPNGCHHVGTRIVVTTDLHRKRDLLVTVWYPAVDGKAEFAPYMDKRTAEAIA